MGTGSVWRAADFASTGRYVVNWSQNRAGTQNISFATSTDLIHWEGDESMRFDIDARFYNTHASTGVRWDCIYTIPATGRPDHRDGYPRHGYWTATPHGCGP